MPHQCSAGIQHFIFLRVCHLTHLFVEWISTQPKVCNFNTFVLHFEYGGIVVCVCVCVCVCVHACACVFVVFIDRDQFADQYPKR